MRASMLLMRQETCICPSCSVGGNSHFAVKGRYTATCRGAPPSSGTYRTQALTPPETPMPFCRHSLLRTTGTPPTAHNPAYIRQAVRHNRFCGLLLTHHLADQLLEMVHGVFFQRPVPYCSLLTRSGDIYAGVDKVMPYFFFNKKQPPQRQQSPSRMETTVTPQAQPMIRPSPRASSATAQI